MTISDRDRAIDALRAWYTASGCDLKGISFADAIAKWESKSPDFLTRFGELLRQSNPERDRVKSAMLTVASQSPGVVPSPYDFGFALADVVGQFTWSDAVAVAEETVQDVADVAKIGLGLWAIAAAVGIVLFFYNTSKTAKAVAP